MARALTIKSIDEVSTSEVKYTLDSGMEFTWKIPKTSTFPAQNLQIGGSYVVETQDISTTKYPKYDWVSARPKGKTKGPVVRAISSNQSPINTPPIPTQTNAASVVLVTPRAIPPASKNPTFGEVFSEIIASVINGEITEADALGIIDDLIASGDVGFKTDF